jgi:integrase/recombinase XerD
MTIRSTASMPGPLKDFAQGFLDELSELGYSSRGAEAQQALVRHLSKWLAEQKLAAGDLTDDVVDRFVAARRRMYSNFRSKRALRPLLDHLRRRGAAPAAAAAVPTTPSEVLIERFSRYLSTERSLAPATVRSYISQVHPFVVAHAGDAGGWTSLTEKQVAAFVTQRAVGQRPRSVQVGVNALRALLRWMWREGMASLSLANAVGSFAAPTGTAPPKTLSSRQVHDLFATLPADGPARFRSEAMLALMVRLGLRAGEVASLQLEDLDWRAGVVVVGGKRGRHEQMPLPVDVGELMVNYLQQGRPVGGTHRRLFLGLDAPHRPLTASAVSHVASCAMVRAGISGGGAAHRLRHTAACGVLAAGGGLVEAGQLLRHSSPETTAIYAKSNLAALAMLARPWPVGVIG